MLLFPSKSWLSAAPKKKNQKNCHVAFIDLVHKIMTKMPPHSLPFDLLVNFMFFICSC